MEQFSRLSEKQRKAEVRKFYDYFTGEDNSSNIPREHLRFLFDQHRRDRWPEAMMTFNNYVFLLQILKILRKRKAAFIVRPWPPEPTDREKLERYSADVQELLETEEIDNMTDKKEVTKTLISRIIRKPYNRCAHVCILEA